jgi:hypothetical protein
MSARENLLRKSCRAPAHDHFIYVSHRQHSCEKGSLPLIPYNHPGFWLAGKRTKHFSVALQATY